MFNEGNEADGEENEVSPSLSPSGQNDTQPDLSSSGVSTTTALDDNHAAFTQERSFDSSSSAVLSPGETGSQRKSPESNNSNFEPSSSCSSLACKMTDGKEEVHSASSSSCPYYVNEENSPGRLHLSSGLREATLLSSVSRHSNGTVGNKEGSHMKPHSVDVGRGSSVEDTTESYHSLSIQKDKHLSTGSFPNTIRNPLFD